MFACICHAVPESVVATAAQGGSSAADIARTTRAGTSCGRCRERLAAIVARSSVCERTGGPCTGCGHSAGG